MISEREKKNINTSCYCCFCFAKQRTDFFYRGLSFYRFHPRAHFNEWREKKVS